MKFTKYVPNELEDHVDAVDKDGNPVSIFFEVDEQERTLTVGHRFVKDEKVFRTTDFVICSGKWGIRFMRLILQKVEKMTR